MPILCLYQNYQELQLLVKAGDSVVTRDIPLEANKLTSTLSRNLIVEIESLLKQSEVDFQALAKIACVHGPSSFTALRITLAALQGIALINSAKVYTCSLLKLEAFASQHKDILLSNQKGGGFFQSFTFTTAGIPTVFSEVFLQENVVCPSLTADVSHLLTLAEREENWGSYHLLQPFYGQTPVFKKKQPFP